jgi:cytochrome c-type biogenesis protein CcmH
MIARLFAGSLLMVWCTLLPAREATPIAEDPVLEARVMAIAEQLRCLVCQNQTIADSQAGLAVDLRKQIREQLKQGMTDRQIMDYMVQRYGDFVLYRPPVKTITWLLWFGPALLLIGGGGILFYSISRRTRQAGANVLSKDEQARAGALLGNGTDRDAR